MGALIHIENMKKIYNPGENEVRALDGIDLDIEKGDLVAIVGHSGSGKSTLMNMLGCLDTPTSGKYVLDGHWAKTTCTQALPCTRTTAKKQPSCTAYRDRRFQ